MAEAHETDAVLTHLSWEDRAWLHHFPLNRDTVLDYFSNSQARPYRASLHVDEESSHMNVAFTPCVCSSMTAPV